MANDSDLAISDARLITAEKCQTAAIGFDKQSRVTGNNSSLKDVSGNVGKEETKRSEEGNEYSNVSLVSNQTISGGSNNKKNGKEVVSTMHTNEDRPQTIGSSDLKGEQKKSWKARTREAYNQGSCNMEATQQTVQKQVNNYVRNPMMGSVELPRHSS